MELPKEVIEAQNLTEDQVTAINEFGTNSEKVFADEQVATAKKEFEGTANKNAEGILSSVATKTHELTGVKREEGEKYADYLSRASGQFLSAQKVSLEKAKEEYEQKIKDVKDAGPLKAEFESLKAEHDEAKKKLAELDQLTEKAQGYEDKLKENEALHQSVAFNSIRPNVPESVNQFEFKAKWGDFQKSVLEKNFVKFVEGEAVYIDKENQYKTGKLSELLEKDEPVQALIQGRKQEGPGGKTRGEKRIDGVPFAVPEKATSAERSKLIQSHLATKGITKSMPSYSGEFAKLNQLILADKEEQKA